MFQARRLGLYCDLDASALEGGWRSAPLHMAAWRGNNAIIRFQIFNYFCLKAFVCETNVIRLLIEEAGANVNCLVLHHPSAPEKSDRETPLHVAARRGRAGKKSSRHPRVSHIEICSFLFFRRCRTPPHFRSRPKAHGRVRTTLSIAVIMGTWK